eukprot:SM000036S13331  [mRNA]  locus=s36:632794:633879:- [translate_table: standard]
MVRRSRRYSISSRDAITSSARRTFTRVGHPIRLEQKRVAIGAALNCANKHCILAGLTMDSLRPSLTSHDATLRHGTANAHPPLHLDLNLLHTQAVTTAWPSMVWLLKLVVELGKVACSMPEEFSPSQLLLSRQSLSSGQLTKARHIATSSVITCAGCGCWTGHLDLGTLLGRDGQVVHDARLSRVQCRHLEQPQGLLHVLFSGRRRPGTRAGNALITDYVSLRGQLHARNGLANSDNGL